MLPAAALEILEPAELELVVAHLRDCQECATLLQEYREVTAALALQLPLRPLDQLRSRALRGRLLARTAGTTRGRALRLDRWIGWAVAAGLAGILLVHHSVHRTLDYGWLAAGILTLVLVGVGVYARTQQRRASALRKELAQHGGKDTKA